MKRRGRQAEKSYVGKGIDIIIKEFQSYFLPQVGFHSSFQSVITQLKY